MIAAALHHRFSGTLITAQQLRGARRAGLARRWSLLIERGRARFRASEASPCMVGANASALPQVAPRIRPMADSK
jgi:hypothetical protein